MFAKNAYSQSGFYLGMLALMIGLLHFSLGPIQPVKPIEKVVAEKTLAIKQELKQALTGQVVALKDTPAEGVDPDKMIVALSISLAGLALLLAAVAFVKREDRRYAFVAMAFGGAAIAMQFLLMAVGTLLAVYLLIFLIASFGGM